MELPEGYEIIESIAVEMDPALDGFAGVLFELVFDGERYVLAETALGPAIACFASDQTIRGWPTRSSRRSFRTAAQAVWRRI